MGSQQIDDPGGYVYFIHAPITDMVKIGWTVRHPDTRLSDIQMYCPEKLRPLGVIRAAYSFENDVHRVFHSYRQHGEWFVRSCWLKDFIETQIESWPAADIPLPLPQRDFDDYLAMRDRLHRWARRRVPDTTPKPKPRTRQGSRPKRYVVPLRKMLEGRQFFARPVRNYDASIPRDFSGWEIHDDREAIYHSAPTYEGAVAWFREQWPHVALSTNMRFRMPADVVAAHP